MLISDLIAAVPGLGRSRPISSSENSLRPPNVTASSGQDTSNRPPFHCPVDGMRCASTATLFSKDVPRG